MRSRRPPAPAPSWRRRSARAGHQRRQQSPAPASPGGRRRPNRDAFRAGGVRRADRTGRAGHPGVRRSEVCTSPLIDVPWKDLVVRPARVARMGSNILGRGADRPKAAEVPFDVGRGPARCRIQCMSGIEFRSIRSRIQRANFTDSRQDRPAAEERIRVRFTRLRGAWVRKPMDSRLRGNSINCVFAVIPAKAGMIVRTVYARRPPTVIPAKAGIHTAYPNTNAEERGSASLTAHGSCRSGLRRSDHGSRRTTSARAVSLRPPPDPRSGRMPRGTCATSAR